MNASKQSYRLNNKMSRTTKKRTKLFIEQMGRCYYCDGQMALIFGATKGGQPDNLATIEHLDSRLNPKRGTRPTEKRIVLACFICNNKQGQKEVTGRFKKEHQARSHKKKLSPRQRRPIEQHILERMIHNLIRAEERRITASNELVHQLKSIITLFRKRTDTRHDLEKEETVEKAVNLS